MNKRKKHVIEKTHELFIEKGYHATSIQEILDHSGISKGSFYNYFPSKADLFKAVFKLMLDETKEKMDKIVIGEDISDVNVFIEQVVLTMGVNRHNKLQQLLDDVIVSHDPDLIKFIKDFKFMFLKWVHGRFLNILPEDKQAYSFDCAIIFMGIMQNFLQTSKMLREKISDKQIAKYGMDRVMNILEDISREGIRLFTPDHVNKLFPEGDNEDSFDNELSFTTLGLRKEIEKVFAKDESRRDTYLKLLYFIQEELMNKEEPRAFLIESALSSLKRCAEINSTPYFEKYYKILTKMDYNVIE
ncbi:TetR/AcrR family transcriptional regulator [Viridibacillus sp. YIM B01967]|uniref:TetR/AcrR family transcriptional regulator n=1 Tax=Viridibacillus soli TaxID=2798301 RepID=A0ABS1H1K7_9BACL|nr:TetR/AcrR family transcriptional regulator [Viridibacillus soli]MBK3493297.1 TetR/AcrR family transcriptional regulator [Viridibacillus soli]